MQTFLNIVVGFPTVVFSILLMVVMLYWLVVMVGLLDTDVLDGLFFDADGVGAGELAGLLSRLGLGQVPITIIVSLIVLFGWLTSYFAVLLLLPVLESQAVHVVLGALIFAGACVAGIALTALALRPVRALIRRVPREEAKVILGRVGVVRTASVSATSGQAAVEDGGAGLLLQIRTLGETWPRGTRVVLIEKIPEMDAWRVIREEEFTGP